MTKRLGKGAQAQVFLVTPTTKNESSDVVTNDDNVISAANSFGEEDKKALKMFNYNLKEEDYAREVAIHERLMGHPNIV